MSRMFSFVCASLLATNLADLCSAQTNTAPVAVVRSAVDNFFGTIVTDPYRYFENKKSPEVVAWMKAHNDQARATLAKIPGRDAMLANLTRYDASVSDRVGSITRLPGDLYFLERRGAADNQFKLYMRRGSTGADTLLVDPESLEKSTGKPHAINWYVPSPDGSVVAYGLSQGGSIFERKLARRVNFTCDKEHIGRRNVYDIARLQQDILIEAPFIQRTDVTDQHLMLWDIAGFSRSLHF